MAKALQELGLDPKSEDFTKEKMKTRFEEEIKTTTDHWQRDRLQHLLDITFKEHSFWEKQVVMQPTKKYVKEGIIKQFKKEEISTERMPLPPGFEWDTFDV